MDEGDSVSTDHSGRSGRSIETPKLADRVPVLHFTTDPAANPAFDRSAPKAVCSESTGGKARKAAMSTGQPIPQTKFAKGVPRQRTVLKFHRVSLAKVAKNDPVKKEMRQRNHRYAEQ
ncbi:MAG TPA: hypothetical protein ENJ23_03910 [Bacteroidetes bacterium]|nr:hypothetical protein [Bacteroidota bacterium]